MLAQNFKTAKDLKITEPQREALMKTLVLMETDKLIHVVEQSQYCEVSPQFTGHFNMCDWKGKIGCGTVCCIGGTAELVGAVSFQGKLDDNLQKLFFPDVAYYDYWIFITVDQAAQALRNYLTTGKANWENILPYSYLKK
jgi:hypothetical protein